MWGIEVIYLVLIGLWGWLEFGNFVFLFWKKEGLVILVLIFESFELDFDSKISCLN